MSSSLDNLLRVLAPPTFLTNSISLGSRLATSAATLKCSFILPSLSKIVRIAFARSCSDAPDSAKIFSLCLARSTLASSSAFSGPISAIRSSVGLIFSISASFFKVLTPPILRTASADSVLIVNSPNRFVSAKSLAIGMRVISRISSAAAACPLSMSALAAPCFISLAKSFETIFSICLETTYIFCVSPSAAACLNTLACSSIFAFWSSLRPDISPCE